MALPGIFAPSASRCGGNLAIILCNFIRDLTQPPFMQILLPAATQRLAFRKAARMRPERPAAAELQSLHAGLAFDPAAALIKLEQVHDGLEEVICGGALTMAPQMLYATSHSSDL